MKSFDGLYGGTFLYCEEEILCYILEKVGYRYVYCSDVQVLHNHSTSFKRSVQNEIERKKIIVNQNRIENIVFEIKRNEKNNSKESYTVLL